MQRRTKMLAYLTRAALIEADMDERTEEHAGRLIGVALWYLCEAVNTNPHAVIVPHEILKKEETK